MGYGKWLVVVTGSLVLLLSGCSEQEWQPDDNWKETRKGQQCPFSIWPKSTNSPRLDLNRYIAEPGKSDYASLFANCLIVTPLPGQDGEARQLEKEFIEDSWIPASLVQETGSVTDTYKIILIIVICAMTLAIAVAVVFAFKLGQLAKPRKPTYWLFQHKLKAFDDDFFAVLDVTSSLKEIIQSMFDKNIGVVGQGRDANGMTHTRLEVLSVQRVENGKLWTKYVRSKAKVPEVTDPDVKKTFKAVGRDCLDALEETPEGKSFLKRMNLDASRNETLLFHGAPMKGSIFPSGWEMPEELCAIKIISKQGFDERLGSMDGMYGSGIYFADKCTKADAYAGRYSEFGSSVGEVCSMYICRVLLGNPYLAEQSLPRLRRPPCTQGHFDPRLIWESVNQIDIPWQQKFPLMSYARCEHTLHDSVVSDLVVNQNMKNYREFVIYEGSYAYPEFLVTYKRVACDESETATPHSLDGREVSFGFGWHGDNPSVIYEESTGRHEDSTGRNCTSRESFSEHMKNSQQRETVRTTVCTPCTDQRNYPENE